MISPDIREQWLQLRAGWTCTTQEADQIERELVATLRLCHESGAHPPSAEVIDAFERARARALAARVQVAMFVDEMVTASLPTDAPYHPAESRSASDPLTTR